MISRFLRELFDTGTIAIGRSPAIDAQNRAAARDVLAEAEHAFRSNLPCGVPEWNADVSLWAAELLFHASRFVVHRDVEADEITKTLSMASPSRGTPSASYSVDLVFRALPDLIRMARGISVDDPLSESLWAIAQAWPFSSVGVGPMPTLDINGFVNDRCLRRVYADRIVARGDTDRLNDPRVAR